MGMMDNPLVKVAIGLTVVLVIAGLSIATCIATSLRDAAVAAAPFLTIVALEWASKGGKGTS